MSRVNCPHCSGPAATPATRIISALTKESTHQCRDIECGHTFVARTEIAYTIRPSGKPNPRIKLPFSPFWRAKPPSEIPAAANDLGDADLAEA